MQAERIVRIQGHGVPMRGDDIDTDRIMPARFLRAVTFEGLEQHLFEDERAGNPFYDSRYAGATILVVNSNFGCGSSREHAPQALYRWGIRAVVGESFSEIFFGNSLMIGLPCVTASAVDVQALMTRIESTPALALTVDLEKQSCTADGWSCALTMPPNAREALISGAWDTTGLLLERFEEVTAVADRLPYVSGF